MRLTVYWLGRILCLQSDFDSVKWVAYKRHDDATCVQKAVSSLGRARLSVACVDQTDAPQVPASTSLLAFKIGFCLGAAPSGMVFDELG